MPHVLIGQVGETVNRGSGSHSAGFNRREKLKQGSSVHVRFSDKPSRKLR
jgi:hypothetical protein